MAGFFTEKIPFGSQASVAILDQEFPETTLSAILAQSSLLDCLELTEAPLESSEFSAILRSPKASHERPIW